MTQPVLVEVIALLPEGWGLCSSCEALIAQADLGRPPPERWLDEYPAMWQEEFARLASWVADLSARYGDQIMVRVYDPRSLRGLFKALRYGVHRYPAFVIAGRDKIVGYDRDRLDGLLAQAGAQAAAQVSTS